MNKKQREELRREILNVQDAKNYMHETFKKYGRDSIQGAEARRMFKSDKKTLNSMLFKFGLKLKQ